MDALASLQGFADADLPVVFVGEPPSLYPEGNNTNQSLFEEKLSKLKESDNVYTIEAGQLATKLSSLGLRPRVAVSTNGTWYTTWRDLNTSSHAIIYSDLNPGTGNVTIDDTRTPYWLNPWTGEQKPVLIYEQDESSTVIPLSLAGNQTVIISFGQFEDFSDSPGYHVVRSPSNVVDATFSANDGLTLRVTSSSIETEAVLSNGGNCELGSFDLLPFSPQNWSLTAEHWEAPVNISDSDAPTMKRNTTHVLESLLSWSEIPELVNTSGVGYYETVFQWPQTDVANTTMVMGAYLSFEKVIHSLRVQLNGQQLKPVDITNAVLDISPYLREGDNTLSVTVPTTMWNYLRTIMAELRTAGSMSIPYQFYEYLRLPIPGPEQSGLVGNVLITPFKVVKC